MSGLMCCLWWFVFGVLLGWLLSWLFNRWFGRSNVSTVASSSPAQPTAFAAPASPAKAMGLDAVAAAAEGFSIKTRDGVEDFIIIEGIGPKINDLLHANHVTTFAQLSKMSIPEISAILEKGGDRFRLANPETWAQQAALCASNRWGELRKLQDELVAGVSMKPDDKA